MSEREDGAVLSEAKAEKPLRMTCTAGSAEPSGRAKLGSHSEDLAQGTRSRGNTTISALK